MAALARPSRSIIIRRIGALWIAALFALAALSFAAPAHAAHAPHGAAAHCQNSSSPAPAEHPCGGDECCPLCGHSQKDLIFSFFEPVSSFIAYAPPRATTQAFAASRPPALESVRERSRAAPRAPPHFS